MLFYFIGDIIVLLQRTCTFYALNMILFQKIPYDNISFANLLLKYGNIHNFSFF